MRLDYIPRRCRGPWIVAASIAAASVALGERINHEGRILGDVPALSGPTLFNTVEADAVVAAMQIFPRDNAWNEDISRRPVLANSDAMIAQITADLASNRRTLRPFYEMNYVLVPDNQPPVPIDFFNWPEESDPSPYPIPSNLPIESWPAEPSVSHLSLNAWQRDTEEIGGDRHAIIVQPHAGFSWETWLTRLTATGWEASNGAKFDLNSNRLRPLGWTSGDAAGLSMFGAIVRFDECQRGLVEHAVRLIVKRTRKGPIYPATHEASVGGLTDPNIPAMGQRLRLKSSFAIPEPWTVYEKAVLRALKKYGAIVADNGNFFSISVTPDQRYPVNAFDNLRTVSISNFEVIQTTGATEGPRSPGAPTANAGPDQTIAPGQRARLAGIISASGAATVRWTAYSGPGPVTFLNPAAADTEAMFTTTGEYVLRLSADDGVHTVAYDAVRVMVTLSNQITLRIEKRDGAIRLAWDGGSGTFQVEQNQSLTDSKWEPLATTTAHETTLSLPPRTTFYRIRQN
jgi:hypothetical protein